MSNHFECKRRFYHLSRAWYGDANLRGSDIIDEILFGFYHPDGGTTGEMSIKWIDLSGKATPMLVCFDDGWDALNEMIDIIPALAKFDGLDPTPESICELLLLCGFEDATPIERPGIHIKPPKLKYSRPTANKEQDV